STGRYSSRLPPTARTTCPFIRSRTGMIRTGRWVGGCAGCMGKSRSGLDVVRSVVILLASGSSAPRSVRPQKPRTRTVRPRNRVGGDFPGRSEDVPRHAKRVRDCRRVLEGGAVALVDVKQLLDAGVHYGHRASRWNPKMRPYIYGKRNLIHIIDLRETVRG